MRPTRPGWYWYRDKAPDGELDIECVLVGMATSNLGSLLVVYRQGETQSIPVFQLPGEWLGEAIPPKAYPDDETLLKRFESGERQKDIAASLGVTPPVIWQKIERARKRLRR